MLVVASSRSSAARTTTRCWRKEPPTSTATSISSVAAADLDAVVARLTDPKLSGQPLGPDLAPAYLRIEMLAIGLNGTEADCVASHAVEGGRIVAGRPSLGDAASTESGLDPSLLLPCVGGDRLGTLAAGTPDFGRVPAADLRSLLTQLGVSSSPGGPVDRRGELRRVEDGGCGARRAASRRGSAGGSADRSAVAGDVSAAVQTCLSPARVKELAA